MSELASTRAEMARKLNQLFRVIHPRSRGEYSAEEVVAAIEARGGPSLSATELKQFRDGQGDDPTTAQLAAIADFFGVNAAYFFDPSATERIDAKLEFLRAMRDSRAFGCVRLFDGKPTPEMLRDLTKFLDALRENGTLADPELATSSTPASGQ